MYGLPADFDSSIFCGRTLDMVCFTAYQVFLHLSDGCLISVEGDISLGGHERFRLPDSPAVLYSLIDKKVESASSTSAGTLSLVFETGKVLNVLDPSKQFEAYSITLKGVPLVRV